MDQFQKTGGMAAIIHAAAYIVGMILGFSLIFPVIGADPGEYLAFVVENNPSYTWNLISY